MSSAQAQQIGQSRRLPDPASSHTLRFKGLEGVSTYLYPMLPYIITMILLILTSKKSRAPKAEGIPYDKGMR